MHIQSSLPKPWEVEQTFHDVLYDWMTRAPWFAVSVAFHLFLFFVLMAIPWDELRPEKPVILEARVLTPLEEFEDPDEVQPVVVEDSTDIEEPVLMEDTLDFTDPVEVADADSEPLDLSAPADLVSLTPIGLGGGAPVKYSGRGFGDPGRPRAGRGVERAIKEALEWLRAHQSPDGSWEGEGFTRQCGEIGASECAGLGSPVHDVGLTGLALLTFLGQGHTHNEGTYRDVVRRGVLWLVSQQEEQTGVLGADVSHDFIYDHTIATLALCEDYLLSGKSPSLRGPAQRAVNFLVRARNPYGAWRYDVPPGGDNDTSITGWVVFALTSARDAGLVVDPAAFEGALSWIEEVTDPATGRVGYNEFGSLSSRTAANERYPRERGEAMTAVGLLARIFLGQTPEQAPVMKKHAELLRRSLPKWEPEARGCDMYYWYYGTYAMYQLGRDDWAAWSRAMKPAMVDTQRTDGDERGSWDPVGPWGYVGGRVYSTALMTLSLEVYFRYGRVLGAR